MIFPIFSTNFNIHSTSRGLVDFEFVETDKDLFIRKLDEMIDKIDYEKIDRKISEAINK